MKNKTTIAIDKEVKAEFKKLKKYPRETDQDTLIRMIKNELSVKSDQETKGEVTESNTQHSYTHEN